MKANRRKNKENIQRFQASFSHWKQNVGGIHHDVEIKRIRAVSKATEDKVQIHSDANQDGKIQRPCYPRVFSLIRSGGIKLENGRLDRYAKLCSILHPPVKLEVKARSLLMKRHAMEARASGRKISIGHGIVSHASIQILKSQLYGCRLRYNRLPLQRQCAWNQARKAFGSSSLQFIN